MKSQRLAYLLRRIEHIYWILALEGEGHSIWDLWTNGFQEGKGNSFLKLGKVGNDLWSGSKNK